jgi:hypothetical protein
MDDPPLLSACMDHARDTLTCGPRLEWLEQVVPSGHDWGTDGQDLLEPARKIGSNASVGSAPSRRYGDRRRSRPAALLLIALSELKSELTLSETCFVPSANMIFVGLEEAQLSLFRQEKLNFCRLKGTTGEKSLPFVGSIVTNGSR